MNTNPAVTTNDLTSIINLLDEKYKYILELKAYAKPPQVCLEVMQLLSIADSKPETDWKKLRL